MVVQLREAFGADAMTEVGLRMVADVRLDLLPGAAIRANSLAPGANRDDSAKRFELEFVLRQQRFAFPLRSGRVSSRIVNDEPDRHDHDAASDEMNPACEGGRTRQDEARHDA